MNKKVVLISCVSKKLTAPAPAKDLYISPYFKYNLKYARMLKPDDIFILSALYGLVPLDKTIEPYNLTLNTMKSNEIKEWADKVLVDLGKVTDIKDTDFIFLAGNNYRKFLIPYLGAYQVPFEGLGIGRQLGKLKDFTSRENPMFDSLFDNI